MSVSFLVIAFIVVASPGTGAIYTLATGLAQGFRASTVAAFGCTLGIVPHLAAAVAGLAAVLHTSAVAFEVLKWAGVGYLLYLAWQTLRERGTLQIDAGEQKGMAERPPAYRIILTAIMINFLNPKLSMFFLAFLPQFVPADQDTLRRMLELSATFMAMTFVVFVVYGAFAAAVRDFITSRPKVLAWMRRSFAAAFVVLGVQLALASR